jgi:hypothetical protein
MNTGKSAPGARQQKKLFPQATKSLRDFVSFNCSGLENHQDVASFKTLKRLARRLNVPLTQLFPVDEDPVQAWHQYWRSRSWSPEEEARYLDTFLRLLTRIDDAGRQLLLATANKMARRKSNGRHRD